MLDAFRGHRVAVAGLGVSGVAVAKAVQAGGGHAIAFDERPAETAAALGTHEILLASGADVVTGWHGRLAEVDFDVMVVSPGFARHHPSIRDAQSMGKPVLSEIEFAYRISEAPIVGITGTNGKSTTTVLAWTIASTLGTAWLAGNISGSGYAEHTLTDAAREAKPDELIVAEISSFQLEWIESFSPMAAAITNITPDHLDRYANFEEYRDTKLRLFEAVPAGGHCFTVEGEPSLPESHVRPHVRDAHYEAVPVASQSDAPWAGAHDLRNLALARALVSTWREPNEASDQAVRDFRGLAHRMERMGERDGLLVINNSMCTNPAAVIASSRSVSRSQVIMLGGATKGLDFTPVGEYLRESGHRAVLFGPLGPNFRDQVGEWPHEEELEDAFRLAVELSSAGSALLFAPGCASALPYANFRVRGEAFRLLAKEWLEK